MHKPTLKSLSLVRKRVTECTLADKSDVTPDFSDLHRENVDALVIPSPTRQGAYLQRVDEVFDLFKHD